MRTLPSKISFIAAACLLANISANGTNTNNYLGRYSRRNNSAFPLMPRLTGDGAAAQQGFVYVDGMLPVYGNNDGFVFADATGKGGTDKGWLAALGGGFRQVWRGAIFGGYVFGERDRTGLGDYFWMVNPGVEVMSPRWDLHVNGYLPVGSKENILETIFADQLNITTFPIIFKGRQQFGEAFHFANQVAPGMDAEVGYIIPNLKRTRVFGGGYYYWFIHAPEIHGVEFGTEVPLNQTFSLLFRDTYDNLQRNTAVFTLRIRLGGINKFDENDVHERLLDIIPRHLGVIYTGTGIPTQQELYDTGRIELERDNIWFFTPMGTTGNLAVGPYSCTYEHPCDTKQLTQGNLNAINGITPNGANIYLAPANYITGAITLNPGESLYGRTANFTQLGQALADIYGNITLMGNNTLEGVEIINQIVPLGPNAGLPIGINVLGGDVNISQVTVGANMTMQALAPLPIGSFATGINLSNANNVYIMNSVVNAGDAESTTSAKAIGISTTNGSLAVMGNNTINVRTRQTSFEASLPIQANGIGIYVASSDTVFVNNEINVVGDATVTNATNSPSLTTNQVGIQLQGNVANAYTNVISDYNRITLTGYANNSNPAEDMTPTVTSTGLMAQAVAPFTYVQLASNLDTININSRAVNLGGDAGTSAAVINNSGVFALIAQNAPNSEVNIAIEGDEINLNLNALAGSGRAYIGQATALKNYIYGESSAAAILSSNNTFTVNPRAESTSGNKLIKGIYGVMEREDVLFFDQLTSSTQDNFVFNSIPSNPPPANVPLIQIDKDSFEGSKFGRLTPKRSLKQIAKAADLLTTLVRTFFSSIKLVEELVEIQNKAPENKRAFLRCHSVLLFALRSTGHQGVNDTQFDPGLIKCSDEGKIVLNDSISIKV